MLEVTRQNLSPMGLRDYASLTLLATYGVQAAEIVSLCLHPVDRHDLSVKRHFLSPLPESQFGLLNPHGKAYVAL
jgi:hypothetical protein